MSNESSSASSGGVGVCGLLGVVFVTLKLLGITAVAEWSWWWVTMPFWGGLALILGIMAVGMMLIAIAALFRK